VRNPITHTGQYIQTERGEELSVLMAWKSIFTVLTRLFLAMLSYDGEYNDPIRGRIEFRNVCSKIDS
jgi:hypothetical protein